MGKIPAHAGDRSTAWSIRHNHHHLPFLVNSHQSTNDGFDRANSLSLHASRCQIRQLCKATLHKAMLPDGCLWRWKKWASLLLVKSTAYCDKTTMNSAIFGRQDGWQVSSEKWKCCSRIEFNPCSPRMLEDLIVLCANCLAQVVAEERKSLIRNFVFFVPLASKIFCFEHFEPLLALCWTYFAVQFG